MMALFEKSKRIEYFISSDGKVFSKNKNSDSYIEKKISLNKNRGYYYVRTTTKNYLVHRLVASAFINNKFNKATVNHIDGNKLNNNINNLEWATYKENAEHAINLGLSRKIKKNEGNIKYSNKQCLDIIEFIRKGSTYRNASRVFNIPYSTIAHLMRGSRRKI